MERLGKESREWGRDKLGGDMRVMGLFYFQAALTMTPFDGCDTTQVAFGQA